MEWVNSIDATQLQYIISFCVSFYGACLFTWWWFRNGKASFAFMCVTMLFIGEITEKAIQIYARHQRVITHSTTFSDDSLLWIYKGLIGTLASFAVVYYMTRKVIRTMKEKAEETEQETEEENGDIDAKNN